MPRTALQWYFAHRRGEMLPFHLGKCCDEGCKAWADGKRLEDNPHPDGTDEAKHWSLGYRIMQRENE